MMFWDWVYQSKLTAQVTDTRVLTYTYDGLQRLIGAREAIGSVYSYTYDLGGNRLTARLNGSVTASNVYNAANQVVGLTYDGAGNLLSDGTTTSTYDALNRQLTTSATSQTRTNTYNGDGVLVAQDANGVLTRYTQDLASPLAEVLQTTQGSAVTHAVYGTDRLFALNGTTRTWYAPDALASVRRTLADAGTPSAPIAYDAWGTPEGGAVPPTFGFTGELQDVGTGMVNLRARWYTPGRGTFTSRDPFEGFEQQPYSLHPYQYASSNPVLWIDPTGSRGCNPEMGVTSSPCMGGEGSSGGPGGSYPLPAQPAPPIPIPNTDAGAASGTGILKGITILIALCTIARTLTGDEAQPRTRDNDTILYFYHGTDIDSARDIIKRGVDPSKTYTKALGDGFYTFKYEAAAEEWTLGRPSRAVVRFTMLESTYKELKRTRLVREAPWIPFPGAPPESGFDQILFKPLAIAVLNSPVVLKEWKQFQRQIGQWSAYTTTP